MDIDQAIRSRRTHKMYAGGAIDDATLRALVELATWAPNHNFTEPWRFHIVRGERVDAMKQAVSASFDAIAKPGDPDLMRKLQQKREKISRRLDTAGAVIAVTWSRSPADETRDREDYAATCCAIQNLLLGAHARGLGSLWSTGGVLMTSTLRAFYGVGAQESIAGVVFLGHVTAELQGRRYKAIEDVLHFV